jgi:anti-sigma factor RsiW
VQCAESLRIQAYFDGEVDALSAAEIERHSERCVACREQLEDLEKTRSAIRQTLTREGAPPELRARLALALDVEAGPAGAASADSRGIHGAAGIASASGISGSAGMSASGRISPAAGIRRGARPEWLRQSFWLGALSGTVGTAVAAGLALLLWLPAASHVFLDELVAAHVRSLMPAHLIDVVSSDQHTVKPWFSGHTDVSPTVADFAVQGYRLVGGRADYLNHQRAAVVVYQHGAHVINVFTWDAGQQSMPKSSTRDGYRMLFWKAGDLAYCAVSDTGWDELSALARLLQAQ